MANYSGYQDEREWQERPRQQYHKPAYKVPYKVAYEQPKIQPIQPHVTEYFNRNKVGDTFLRGKYKTFSFEEVITSDPGYIENMATRCEIPSMAEDINNLRGWLSVKVRRLQLEENKANPQPLVSGSPQLPQQSQQALQQQALQQF